MDWSALLKAVGPTLISLLGNTVSNLGTPIAPPTTPSAPVPSGAVAHPSAAVKDLQILLNLALALNPPLVADGWLGPKTEQAIETGIAKLKSLGIG